MKFELGYHRRAAVSKYMHNNEILELFDLMESAKYPSDEYRKFIHGKSAKSIKTEFRKIVTLGLASSWDRDVSIFDTTKVPSTKLHFLKNRVGVLRTMSHRTSVGTDILRFEVAHRVLDLIDIGVFICVTRRFENYYIGTEKVKRSQIIILEELEEYLEMISDIITVPLLLVGLKPPSSYV